MFLVFNQPYNLKRFRFLKLDGAHSKANYIFKFHHIVYNIFKTKIAIVIKYAHFFQTFKLNENVMFQAMMVFCSFVIQQKFQCIIRNTKLCKILNVLTQLRLECQVVGFET